MKKLLAGCIMCSLLIMATLTNAATDGKKFFEALECECQDSGFGSFVCKKDKAKVDGQEVYIWEDFINKPYKKNTKGATTYHSIHLKLKTAEEKKLDAEDPYGNTRWGMSTLCL